MLSTRLKLRLAGHLQRSWPRKLPPDPDSRDWKHLESYLERLDQSHIRWKHSKHHRLSLLLPTLYQETRTNLEELTRHLTRLRAPLDESLNQIDQDPWVLSLRHWLAELRQLEDEFDDLTVDWKANTLKVSTDFITLKDVPLGRFSIVFGWNRVGSMSGSRCFDLIALDPNPARTKDRVTHPHVQDEELCTGDASRALENAINEGRLADAFLLICSVMTTYNPASPYVPLDEWEGISCGECGDSIGREEGSCCEICLCSLCDSCLSSCSSCSDSRCGSCLDECDGCQRSFCPGCLETLDRKSFCHTCIGNCAECEARITREDLSADFLCPTCLEQQEMENDSTTKPDRELDTEPESDEHPVSTETASPTPQFVEM